MSRTLSQWSTNREELQPRGWPGSRDRGKWPLWSLHEGPSLTGLFPLANFPVLKLQQTSEIDPCARDLAFSVQAYGGSLCLFPGSAQSAPGPLFFFFFFFLSICICNPAVSKPCHILRCWRNRVCVYLLQGGNTQSLTTLSAFRRFLGTVFLDEHNSHNKSKH